MISEIFPLKVRSAAMSVSTVAYAGFGVAAIVFFAARLPETKNRSLEEISEEVTDEPVSSPPQRGPSARPRAHPSRRG